MERSWYISQLYDKETKRQTKTQRAKELSLHTRDKQILHVCQQEVR
jgi:hypothetical protein